MIASQADNINMVGDVLNIIAGGLLAGVVFFIHPPTAAVLFALCILAAFGINSRNNASR